MRDLREYSYRKVGDIWSEADHIFLISQLDKIDKLAQAVFNANRNMEKAAAKVRALR